MPELKNLKPDMSEYVQVYNHFSSVHASIELYRLDWGLYDMDGSEGVAAEMNKSVENELVRRSHWKDKIKAIMHSFKEYEAYGSTDTAVREVLYAVLVSAGMPNGIWDGGPINW